MSIGFAEINDNQELFKKTIEETKNILEEKSTNGLNWNEIEIDITKLISDFIYNETRRRPKVLARIEKISL
jgi:mRNA degradation ribonuclease J1/J2